MGSLEYQITTAELSARIGALNIALDQYKSEEDREYINKLLKRAWYKYNKIISSNIPF